jgi:TatD DNase family protein
MLFDTHCHIHETDYPLDVNKTLDRAHQAGVQHMVCVGTSNESSVLAVECARVHQDVYASIGVHPHETKYGFEQIRAILASKPHNLVAIGEIGLDYFYTHSPREVQIQALKDQIQIALDHNLPIIFHVREAFDDFWPIFDSFKNIKGVLHSFTDSLENMEKGIERGLYIGVNGISTFTKDESQKAMFKAIPLDHLLVETDAPFLTPIPFRGKVNEPAFVKNVAEYHAEIRNIDFNEVADTTTANARALFAL